MQKDAQAAHFYLCAAHAAIDRRRAAQKAKEARGGGAPAPLPGRVGRGVFMGQIVIADGHKRLTDEQFLQHLEVSHFKLVQAPQGKIQESAIYTRDQSLVQCPLLEEAAETRRKEKFYES